MARITTSRTHSAWRKQSFSGEPVAIPVSDDIKTLIAEVRRVGRMTTEEQAAYKAQQAVKETPAPVVVSE